MGIWTFFKFQNKNMQKQKWQEDLIPMRHFKIDYAIDVNYSQDVKYS